MCDTPYYITHDRQEMPVQCGSCPPCKKRRVSAWVFRLKEEDKISSSSYFVTLTYDNDHVPITEMGTMGLRKKDLQDFWKRLRRKQKSKIKYYAVGEYGSKTERPHYHAIIFNVEDTESIYQSWKLGEVHIGEVSGASIAYTTKYIDKESKIPYSKSDLRIKQFSVMSNQLGKSYLKPGTIKWHKSDLENNFITTEGGAKIALPRYYRDKIFTEEEKEEQRDIIAKKYKDQRTEQQKRLDSLYKGRITLYDYNAQNAVNRYHQFQKFNKSNRS